MAVCLQKMYRKDETILSSCFQFLRQILKKHVNFFLRVLTYQNIP